MFKHLFLIYCTFVCFYKCGKYSCTSAICISKLLPNLHPSFGWTERSWMLNTSWSSENLCIHSFCMFNLKDALRNYCLSVSGVWLIFAFKLHCIKLLYITRVWNPDLTLTISPKISVSLGYIAKLCLPLSNPINAWFLCFCNSLSRKYVKLTHSGLTTSQWSLGVSREHQPFQSGKNAQNPQLPFHSMSIITIKLVYKSQALISN